MGNKAGGQTRALQSKFAALGLTPAQVSSAINEAKAVFHGVERKAPRLPRLVASKISQKVLEGPVVVVYRKQWTVFSLDGYRGRQKRGVDMNKEAAK